MIRQPYPEIQKSSKIFDFKNKITSKTRGLIESSTINILIQGRIYTCFSRCGNHWHDCDEDCGDDVNDREEEMDFDGSLQVGTLPPQPRHTHYSQTDGNLRVTY